MLKFEGQTPSALTGAVRTLNVYLLRDGDRFGHARFTQSEFKVRRLCKSSTSMAKTVSIPIWTTPDHPLVVTVECCPRCQGVCTACITGRSTPILGQ